MRLVLWKLETLAQTKFNIVWSFDNSVFFDFTIFGKRTLAISHIVDPNQNFETKVAAKTASVCFCNTDLLLSRLLLYNKNVHKINHGYNVVRDCAEVNLPGSNGIKVTYVGNLNIPYIDWEILYTLTKENADVDFIFIGPGFETLSPTNDLQTYFKHRLAEFPNVYAVGKMSSNLVPAFLNKSDAMLICYQEKYHHDQAANSHKFMEYLGVGKVIVSSFTKEFEAHQHIIAMVESNALLPGVFQHVVENLVFYNSDELMQKRKDLAADNTYEKQIERIERIIYAVR